jgi:hypothetical protein
MTIRRLATALGVVSIAGVLIAGALAATTPSGSAQSPPAPIKLRGPARTTINRTAAFTWARVTAQASSSFRCRLDHDAFTRCKSGVAYRRLRRGRHVFTVVAVDAAGRRSAAARGNAGSSTPSWSWTIVAPIGAMAIWGEVGSRLYPGASAIPIDLSLRNPNGYRLRVTQIVLGVRTVIAPHATPALPCTTADFATTNYTGHTFVAPSGSSTLGRDHVPRARWPTVAMLDRPVNQDGCMGATLELAYRDSTVGPAHEP